MLPYRYRIRLPHIVRHSDAFFWCWRLYGLKPHYRLCLFDWTIIIFETNRHHRVAVGCLHFEWSL